MPVNVTAEYAAAELAYTRASTTQEKIAALQKMLQEVPKHKGSEKLQAEIKSKLAKFKATLKKQAQLKKKAFSIAIKKEGAAQVALVGTTNSGKSTLLARLTNAKPEIAAYPFTTKLPETGMLDYKGVKIQIVEIPAITKNFYKTEKGPIFLGIIRTADLIILLFNSPSEEEMLKHELKEAGIDLPIIIYKNQEKLENIEYFPNKSLKISDFQRNLKDLIWKKLGLIKVYTKQPGKKPTEEPIALKKDCTVKDFAEHVHKDFIRKFKYAKIWGSSAKFDGQMVGLDHVLEDEDVVQLHLQ